MTASWFVRLLVGVLLLTTGMDIIRPMVSYRALELGATTTQIGLLAGSYAVLSLLVAAPTGRWVDRFGETRFVVGGAVAMTLMALWLAAAGSVLSLGVAQAWMGAGQVLGLVALQTLVANASTAGQRDGRFGAFAVTGSTGQVVGPSLGGFISAATGGSTGPALLVGALILGGLVAVGVSLHRWPPPADERQVRSSGPQQATLPAMLGVLRMRSMPQAMVASMTVLAAIDILVAYVPVYGEARGIPVATVGLLLSARAAASAVSRLAMVPMIRGLGRRRLFILGLLLPAASLALVPATDATPALFALLAIAGFGLGLGQPMSLAWVTNVAPPEARGTAVGVRLTGNRAGQVLLPAAVGVFGGATSVAAIFVALGVILAGSAGVVLTATFEDAPP